MEKCYALCQNDKDREHSFYTIRKNRDKVKTFQVLAPPELCWPQWRWTLDTIDDYHRICRIYEHFYHKDPTFTSQDIAKFMLADPSLTT